MNDFENKLYPTSIRIPAQLKTDLEQLAKDDRRSLNNFIICVLEDFVSERKRKNRQDE